MQLWTCGGLRVLLWICLHLYIHLCIVLTCHIPLKKKIGRAAANYSIIWIICQLFSWSLFGLMSENIFFFFKWQFIIAISQNPNWNLQIVSFFSSFFSRPTSLSPKIFNFQCFKTERNMKSFHGRKFSIFSSVAGMATVCWSLRPPLWSRLKYANNHWRDCLEILSRLS